MGSIKIRTGMGSVLIQYNANLSIIGAFVVKTMKTINFLEIFFRLIAKSWLLFAALQFALKCLILMVMVSCQEVNLRQ